jgi:hypothetical protein
MTGGLCGMTGCVCLPGLDPGSSLGSAARSFSRRATKAANGHASSWIPVCAGMTTGAPAATALRRGLRGGRSLPRTGSRIECGMTGGLCGMTGCVCLPGLHPGSSLGSAARSFSRRATEAAANGHASSWIPACAGMTRGAPAATALRRGLRGGRSLPRTGSRIGVRDDGWAVRDDGLCVSSRA